jgi:hypothetical protein
MAERKAISASPHAQCRFLPATIRAEKRVYARASAMASRSGPIESAAEPGGPHVVPHVSSPMSRPPCLVPHVSSPMSRPQCLVQMSQASQLSGIALRHSSQAQLSGTALRHSSQAQLSGTALRHSWQQHAAAQRAVSRVKRRSSLECVARARCRKKTGAALLSRFRDPQRKCHNRRSQARRLRGR